MRLWHKDLIPYLPKNQLLGQWRECCCIAKNIATKGTPNHILVNKIMDYPAEDFVVYVALVEAQMKERGYKVSKRSYDSMMKNIMDARCYFPKCIDNSIRIYKGWHNRRYLSQCYYNLQEKYDCGSVSKEEWSIFLDGYMYLLNLTVEGQ